MPELANLAVRLTAQTDSFEAGVRKASQTLTAYKGTVTGAGASIDKLGAKAATTALRNKKFADSFTAAAVKMRPAIANMQAWSTQADAMKSNAKLLGVSTRALQNDLYDLGVQYGIAADQIDSANRQMRASRFHTANLAAQFNDIGVMMASGQSPFILAVQQGTQITQVLQSMGGTAKQQLGALASAFKSIISPTALVTVAVIAGAAALYQWATRAEEAEEEAEDFADVLKRVKDEAKAANEAYFEFRQGMSSDQIAVLDRVSALLSEEAMLRRTIVKIEANKHLRARQALGTLRERLATAEEERKELEAILVETVQFTIKLREAKQEHEALVAAAEAYGDVIEENTKREEELAKKRLSAHEALVRAADTLKILFGEQLETERLLLEKAEERLGVYRQMNQTAPGQRMPGRSRGPGGPVIVPDPSNFGQGGPATLEEWQRLNRSNNQGGSRRPGLPFTDQSPRRSPNPLARGTLGENFITEVERMKEEFKTRLELEQEYYTNRQELINKALETEQITAEDHKELMRRLEESHAQEMFRLEMASNQTRLGQMESFMGNMATALAQGNDGMLQAAKLFGAAEALINAWRTFSLVMADPTLPWFMRYPAALGAFAQAIQAVSAIKGVTLGGGGRKSAGGGAAGGERATRSAGPAVSLTLIGDQGFTRAQVVQIAEALNEAGTDGSQLVAIRGRR